LQQRRVQRAANAAATRRAILAWRWRLEEAALLAAARRKAVAKAQAQAQAKGGRVSPAALAAALERDAVATDAAAAAAAADSVSESYFSQPALLACWRASVALRPVVGLTNRRLYNVRTPLSVSTSTPLHHPVPVRSVAQAPPARRDTAQNSNTALPSSAFR
jgi:hypothetical protein